MGNSQPTVTEQIEAFREAHKDFRQWLPRREQVVFDQLIMSLYRHGPALNMTEDLDFNRRVLLVAYLDLAARVEEQIGRLHAIEAILKAPAPDLPVKLVL